MDSNRLDDRNRLALGPSSERIIFYVDDLTTDVAIRDPSADFYRRSATEPCFVLCPPTPDPIQMDERSALYPPSPNSGRLQLNDRSALYPPSSNDVSRRGSSVCSQTADAPRRSRNTLDVDQRSSRRSSVQSGRSRTNSCTKMTPLGDGRRASVTKKPRPRRTSTARRKDSVRPARTEMRESRKAMEDAREVEQARRHRRIAMIVLGTFLFLLAASVLVVVITLTNSSFLSPPTGSKELTEHRAQLRKENEELLNSLNRDTSVPSNWTTPP